MKKKTSLDLMREIRTTWSINPRTRVHDNDIRKSKKKMRNESRKVIKKALGDDPKSFFMSQFCDRGRLSDSPPLPTH